MTKSDRPAITTKVADIVDYWRPRETECGLSVDWSDAHRRCWRCGRKAPLQKCHIIPHKLDGADSADNLVLLCARCHREAPNVSDPAFMWVWLRRYAVTFYDTDWIVRGFEEFERMFGRRAFANLAPNLPEAVLVAAVKKYRQRAIIHFGQGRPNPSTVAWIFLQMEKDLLNRGADC